MAVLKIHLFLLFGSLSGVLPFIAIIAEEYYGFSSKEIGILLSILPIVVFLIRKVFASLALRKSAHKLLLILAIQSTILGYGLLLTTIYFDLGHLSWYLFCILIVIGNCGQGVVTSLSNFLVKKEVTHLDRNYRQYKIAGTVGWGVCALTTALLTKFVFNKFLGNQYFPYLSTGLVMFTIIAIIDVFFVFFKIKTFTFELKTKSSPKQSTASKPKAQNKSFVSLSQIFRLFWAYPSVLQYLLIVLVIGVLTALHQFYYFWFLQIIVGRDPFVYGIALAVQSILGELPIILSSKLIVRWFGPSVVFNITLSAFVLRYSFYGFVLKIGTRNHLKVLIIELIHGLTSNLFLTAVTNLAKFYANEVKRKSYKEKVVQFDCPETVIENSLKASPQNSCFEALNDLLINVFEVVGLSVGALVGGYVIYFYNVFFMWKMAAVISCATILLNITLESIKYSVLYFKNFGQ